MEIIEIANIFRANIIDVNKETVTVEITGGHDKIEAIRDMLDTYGIIELARTGVVALERGNLGLSI